MALYRCPFCKIEIIDDIISLVAHREPGGECDQEQLKNNPILEEEL